jgi:LmbE family N-acetylglucosaminyl deacetylase
MIFQNKRILLVVAHPDDEILGLGGTMHKLITKFSCQIKVVILGEGITSRSQKRSTTKWENELVLHKNNIKKAGKFIGFLATSIYDFPDNRFDTVALLDIIKVIEKEKQNFKPEVIFTHHGGDVNIDHQRTFDAVITACRPIENESVKSIITFETVSGTEWRASSDPRHFIPNLFVEISESDLRAKINAMESYEFEKRPYPHPRSPEALRIRAQMWGVANGLKLAEAFQIIRVLQ